MGKSIKQWEKNKGKILISSNIFAAREFPGDSFFPIGGLELNLRKTAFFQILGRGVHKDSTREHARIPDISKWNCSY